jgi:hypothetical protein
VYVKKSESYEKTYVFSELTGKFVSEHDFVEADVTYKGGGFLNGKLFYITRDKSGNNPVKLWEAYADPLNYSSLAGQDVTPEVTFYVNPEEGISKVFDILILHATDRLLTADFQVVRDSGEGTQIGTQIDLSTIDAREEGTYRMRILRDLAGKRLRGTLMKVTLRFDNTREAKVALRSVVSRFRPSMRYR